MLNDISLQGRLVRDSETKTTASGYSCAVFTLACDRDFKSQNGERETDFFEVIAWRSTADFVQTYFRKGRMVVVKGRLQNRQWTANDGSKRTTAQIVADSVYFSDSVKESGSTSTAKAEAAPVQDEDTGYTVIDDVELPF